MKLSWLLDGVLLAGLIWASFGCTKNPERKVDHIDKAMLFDCAPTPAELQELEANGITQGHQPWRLDPSLTARASLLSILVSKFGYSPDTASELIGEDTIIVLKSEGRGHRSAIWRRDDMTVEMRLQNSKVSAESGIWYCHSASVQGLRKKELEG